MTKAWLGQPHMVKKIEKTFGEMVKSLGKEHLRPLVSVLLDLRRVNPR
jgi:hypothetical protein